MRACGEPRTMSLVELSLHAGMDFVSLRSDGNVVAAWSVQPMALLAHALAQLRPSVRALATRSLGRSTALPIHGWQNLVIFRTRAKAKRVYVLNQWRGVHGGTHN